MVPKKEEAEKENSERWLVTYSDLITLLLIFFVVLYSMSSVSAKKFDELAQSMAVVFGQGGRSGVLDGGRSVIPDMAVHKQKRNITNTREQIRRMIANLGLEGKITVREEDRGIVISVKDTVFFKPGSADLGEKAQEIIANVASLLSGLPNSIRVEGHTDNIPIHTFKYYSNWELSTARATNVLHYMVQEKRIDPVRFSAAGYGEFKPVESNDTEAGRAANRRVDIVILNEDFEKLEPPAAENEATSEYDRTVPSGSGLIPDTVKDEEL